MSEQESKLYALYQAVHLMMARLGADGEIDTRAPEVDAVMDAMHEYDGGQYIQWNTPQPVTPAGGEVVAWFCEAADRRDQMATADAVVAEGWADLGYTVVGLSRAAMDAEHWAELHRLRVEIVEATSGKPWRELAASEKAARIAAERTHPPVADAALVRDAERYRWLKGPAPLLLSPRPEIRVYTSGRGYEVLQGDRADAAIDAALNQRGGDRG